MLRPAFSTVACPTWTLDRVVAAAGEHGFAGVELRSFGEGGSEFACDPALTDPTKVRRLFADAGVEAAGVASGVHFDAPIRPPVLGHVLASRDAAVREGKHMVRLAHAIGARHLRVFGFQIPGRERRAGALRRICGRLAEVCDAARNREVQVLIENAGSFPRAADLAEIIERVGSPLLSACYDLAPAHAAGESVGAGVELLGPRLKVARIRDERAGRACGLGTGELPCREFVQAVRRSDEEWGTHPWVVFTWDRAWLPELAPAEEVLPGAARAISEWSGGSGPAGGRAPGARSMATA